MIRRTYSSSQRRAVNQIYNGAERYDFEPFFLAVRPDGEPELYVNTLIGLSVKWLDMDLLSDFFNSYAGNLNSGDLDEIVWLGLENCLYEKEISHRPVLKKMREDYARSFFRSHRSLSRQQMMAMNVRIFEQREARWAAVIDHKMPVLTPKAEAFHQALALDVSLNTAGVIEALREILITYLHVREFHRSHESGRSVSRTMASFLQKVIYRETHETDQLLVRQSGTDHGARGRQRRLEKGRHISVSKPEDEDYIRHCFGRCLYSEKEMRILENDLCSDAHELCHLYLAGSVPADGDTDEKESLRFRTEVQKQAEKNKACLDRSRMEVSSTIHSLSAQLDTILATFAVPMMEQSRQGRLDSAKCYRLALLQDPDVFQHPADEKEHQIRVDLLLDASASRLNVQENIALQTWTLAESLRYLHIPVRVMAFRSLRGYTVLQRLKDYEERSDGILNYYAAGWNRDGLALRTMGRLIREASSTGTAGISPFDADGRINDGCEHLLFILTDANPDDSTPLAGKDRFHLDRPYEDSDAVLDTAEEVRKLRLSGIHTMAVYLGSTAHVENLHTIYGTEYVSVRSIDTMASRIAMLLEKSLYETAEREQ